MKSESPVLPKNAAPSRLTEFKNFKPGQPLNTARLDTEFDQIYNTLTAVEEFLRVAHDGDGKIRLRSITEDHLTPDALRDVAEQVGKDGDKLRAMAAQTTTSIQNLLRNAADLRDDTREAATEAKFAATAARSAEAEAQEAQKSASEHRNLAHKTLQQSNIRAQDAGTSASSARISEDMAYRWAEKMDGPVFVPEGGDEVDDGFYSAKYWAMIARDPNFEPPEYSWDDITDKPTTYPPEAHTHPWSEITNTPATYPPSAHQHPEADISDLDRVRDQGAWQSGAYLNNDMVTDWPYTAVANKDTSDRPAPQGVGQPQFVYEGTSPEDVITAKTLLVQHTYTLPFDAFVPSYRMYLISGNQYSAFLRREDTGNITQLWSLEADQTGWRTFYTAGNLTLSGTAFTVGLYAVEPDPSPVTFSGEWNYQTPNNPTTPGVGQISHANKALDSLRVHKTDDNGGDRSAELLGIEAGDVIDGLGMRWSVQAVVDQGLWMEFSVAPAQQGGPTGVDTFTFETVEPTPITTIIDPDYYLSNANVQPSFSIDGADAVNSQDAYAIDIEVQEAQVSDDWNIIAGSAVGGTGATLNHEEYHDPADVGSWSLTNGVLTCWGTAEISNSDGTNPTIVTYPRPFATAPSNQISVVSSGSPKIACTQGNTAAEFKVRIWTDAGDTDSATVRWFAVGKEASKR